MATVLVVEDTKTEAVVITSALQGAGFTIVQAGSSEEAKIKLEQQKPDLIILDVVLPGISGFELCRELKEQPDTQSIPVVICSTKNSEMDKFWGMKQGASSYITKPIATDELVRTAKQLVGG
jgi:two-component system, chemotaxis family, response regulator PixH